MSEGYNGTREISIGDMLLYICQRWRSIIVCLIIGAIVLGIYGYFASDKTVTMTQAEKAVYNLQKDEAEQEIIQTELIAQQIKALEKNVDSQVAFNENAMIMNIDPYNVSNYELKYFINNHYAGDGTNYGANAIAEAFRSALRSRGFAVDLEDELLGTSAGNLLSYLYEDVISIETGEDMGVFVITVYGNTKENAEKVASVVKTAIGESYAAVAAALGEFDLVLLGESNRTTVEPWIMDVQQQMSEKAMSMSKKIKELKDSVSNSDQKIYLDYLLSLDEEKLSEELEASGAAITEEEAEAIAAQSTKEGKRGISKKYIAIGGFLGVILAALFYLIRYIALGFIMTRDEITDSFGIQVLGTFEGDAEFNKKRKTKLDKWLLGLRRKKKNALSYEESVEMVSAKIQIAAEKNGMENLCLALSKNLIGSRNFVDDVVKVLQENFNITVVSNILGEAESLSDMSAKDGVVLVEQLEESKHKDVHSECVLCSTYGVSIIGAVVVE